MSQSSAPSLEAGEQEPQPAVSSLIDTFRRANERRINYLRPTTGIPWSAVNKPPSASPDYVWQNVKIALSSGLTDTTRTRYSQTFRP